MFQNKEKHFPQRRQRMRSYCQGYYSYILGEIICSWYKKVGIGNKYIATKNMFWTYDKFFFLYNSIVNYYIDIVILHTQIQDKNYLKRVETFSSCLLWFSCLVKSTGLMFPNVNEDNYCCKTLLIFHNFGSVFNCQKSVCYIHFD